MKALISLLIGTLILLWICEPKHIHKRKPYYVNDNVYTYAEFCTTTQNWIIEGEHYE